MKKSNSEPQENSILTGQNYGSSSYQTIQNGEGIDWNVEIDVKGQVNTGPEEDNVSFSFSKLLQYTGPGM
jgi:natural resistance-associated macrophage protein